MASGAGSGLAGREEPWSAGVELRRRASRFLLRHHHICAWSPWSSIHTYIPSSRVLVPACVRASQLAFSARAGWGRCKCTSVVAIPSRAITSHEGLRVARLDTKRMAPLTDCMSLLLLGRQSGISRPSGATSQTVSTIAQIRLAPSAPPRHAFRMDTLARSSFSPFRCEPVNDCLPPNTTSVQSALQTTCA